MGMPDGNGDLRITIKDLYLAQQEFGKKQVDSERKLSETFADLKITLVQIQNHISSIDTRNAAADQLNIEHARRIQDLERIVESQGLRNVREERHAIVLEIDKKFDSVEKRFDELERGVVGEEAVKAYRAEAGQAKNNARNMFWAMVIAIATALGTLITLIVLIRSHH